MNLLVLQENIARHERFLQSETNEASRRSLQRILQDVRRELRLLEANMFGARSGPPLLGRQVGAPVHAPAILTRFRNEFEASPHPYLLLDPRPGIHIVDANLAYQQVTMTGPAIAGAKLFEVFPDNPQQPDANGTQNLFTSLRQAVLLGRQQFMPVQRYDVRDHRGVFVERHWRPVNTPIFDEQERLLYVLHHVEEVTPA
jgi:hypothetical protein